MTQSNVPPTYFCFKCKSIGAHWIMQCPSNQPNNRNRKVTATNTNNSNDIREVTTVNINNQNSENPKPQTEIVAFKPDTEDSSQSTLSSDLSATAKEFIPIEPTQPTCYEHNPYIFINQQFEDEINTFYTESRPSSKYKQSCDDLFGFVSECVMLFNSDHKPLQKWDIFRFGGNVWTVDTNYSDIDMAIDIKEDKPTKSNKQYILQNISKIIKKRRTHLMIEDILHARYPIITIYDTKSDVCIDLSISDQYCKQTTQLILELINNLSQNGYPIRELIVFVKYWSKQCGINDGFKCYPNSFGYTLMVIKFMQCIVHSQRFIIANDKHLSCLIFGFYSFYAFQFENGRHAISINDGCEELFFGNKSTDSVLEIVDPVNAGNNVAKNVKKREYYNMQFQLRRACRIYSDYIKNDCDNNNDQSLFALLTL